MTQSILTIGTQGMHDESFIALLCEHGVDLLVDIRLRNEGRYYKFASGKHIKALVEAHGIAYRHETRFSPTPEMLDRFRADDDWPAYEESYRELIQSRAMGRTWQKIAGGFKIPCLLCAEKTPEHCHRRLLAECLAQDFGVPIVHVVSA